MDILNNWKISGGLTIAEVQRFPDDVYRSQLEEFVLKQSQFLPWRDQLTETDIQKIGTLSEKLSDTRKLRLALLDGSEMVGWTFGWQESSDSFYMAASMVLPEYRKKGFYSELVKKVLFITKDEGFQSLSSRHALTNNPVIIAKLKLGFLIKGIEIDAVHGPLLNLSYYHNELLNSAARFRSGAVGEEEVGKLLLQ